MTIKCYGCGKELHGIFGHPAGEPLFCSFDCHQKREKQIAGALQKMRKLLCVDQLEVLNEVRALHARFGSHCFGCDDTWPCRTIQILDREPERHGNAASL